MKRRAVVLVMLWLVVASPAAADGIDKDHTYSGVETLPEAVRVTVVKVGGVYSVEEVRGGAGAREGCAWTVLFAPSLEDSPYGTSPGPKPDPEARFALLLCDGSVVRAIWVAPSDVVDLDAAARQEAQRYVEDVLTPAVGIGINPSSAGLAGLRSWFWVEGFDGTVTAPPIAAFGLTIDVRMSTRSVTWDFGDGTVADGDLGRAYPQESSVQHAHRRAGTFAITASITLIPEYRVNGGGWVTLADLTATATALHRVEERQSVVTDV